MAAERLSCTEADAAAVAARVREMVPAGASVADAVRGIVADVRARGDAAVVEYERRYAPRPPEPTAPGGAAGAERAGSAEPGGLVVSPAELDAALAALDPAVRGGLELAIANVRAVAEAGLDAEADVTLPDGQWIRLREVPVRRAGVYAPGGRAPYPSSVVMGVATAKAAGVDDVVVATAPHPVTLAACALCGADAVYRMSGAQAIAALAHGTETVHPVDVIVGPGNLYVQEAKRQVLGEVGIDGFAGPSDLLALVSAGADRDLIALDLRAQAEHGDDTLVVAVSDDAALLDAIGTGVLVHADTLDAALAFAEALAPEHLQLAGAAAEGLAPRVRAAGCLFVGEASATAFGDYIAGSNHTLPTEGAARFASGLSTRHFRRRMAEVRVGEAAGALARAAVPIARAEGFDVHAESMEARMRQNRTP